MKNLYFILLDLDHQSKRFDQYIPLHLDCGLIIGSRAEREPIKSFSQMMTYAEHKQDGKYSKQA